MNSNSGNISGLIFDDLADKVWVYAQIFVFISLIVFSILLVRLYRQAKMEAQKEIQKGFMLFSFTIVLTQLFYLMQIIHSRLEGVSGNLYPRYIKIGGTGFEYLMILFLAFGYLFLMKPIEKYLLNREKLVITTLNKISIVALIIPYIGSVIYHEGDWIIYWTDAAYPGLVIFIFASLFSILGSFYFYLRLGFQSSGILRKKGFLIGIGILIMYIAVGAGSFINQEIGGWAGAIFHPILLIMGAVMTIVGLGIES
ncbi:MAG: hypothetical protein ACTSU2_07850 [Promethearchaeota archaeon]